MPPPLTELERLANAAKRALERAGAELAESKRSAELAEQLARAGKRQEALAAIKDMSTRAAAAKKAVLEVERTKAEASLAIVRMDTRPPITSTRHPTSPSAPVVWTRQLSGEGRLKERALRPGGIELRTFAVESALLAAPGFEMVGKQPGRFGLPMGFGWQVIDPQGRVVLSGHLTERGWPLGREEAKAAAERAADGYIPAREQEPIALSPALIYHLLLNPGQVSPRHMTAARNAYLISMRG